MGSDLEKASATGDDSTRIGRHVYVEEEKTQFRSDPAFFLRYRKDLETKMTKSFPVLLRGTPLNIWAKKAIHENMLAKIGLGHDEIKEKLIPTWSPGCRRITVCFSQRWNLLVRYWINLLIHRDSPEKVI
jgi:hypothetical protein